MKHEIRAIETRYKGYRFRSRIEARWAVFFDALGLSWRYEPEGFDLGGLGWYLPDFFIEGNDFRGPYVEIKPTAPSKKEIEKLADVCDAQGAYGLLIWGEPGSEKWISIHKEGMRDYDEECSMLGNKFPPNYEHNPVAWGRSVSAARAARFEHGETP